MHTHAVQLYEQPSFLLDTVVQFLAAGLDAGERVIVVARPERCAGFSKRLEKHGGALAVQSGQLLMLDARDTLARFMAGDLPCPDSFHSTIDELLDVPGQQRRPIRAYGEMVELLWRDGNPSAAIRLEQLWNEACQLHAVSLLCSYAMDNFCHERDTELFSKMCASHSHVIPTERFVELDDPAARMLEISILQQRARALETELSQRKEVEAALRASVANGNELGLSDAQARDLVPLVKRIVDEARTAHPRRGVRLETHEPCVAHIDSARIEQVVTHLLYSAIAHGDPQRPVTVSVMAVPRAANIAVHHHSAGRSALGIGLALHVSECIVAAHRGHVHVESSAETGTLFEVSIPRS